MNKPEVINGMTFEMAQTEVQGTKFKAINRFKQFTTTDFDYDDLVSEVDMAIIKAWKDWNPEESKFNTYVTNMINWMIYRALENFNEVFKMNRRTKMNLNNRGESFKTLSKKRITADKEFNETHGLDGKTPFTRELFNTYVYHVTSSVYGVHVKSQSSFTTAEGDALEIMDMQSDDSAEHEIAEIEFDMDLSKVDPTIKKVYTLISEGHTIKDALKKSGTTKARLKSLYTKSVKKQIVLV